MTLLLILRRARRDVGLLVIWILLVACAAGLSVAQPRLLRETVDLGARQAVAAAGSDADLVVTGVVTSHRDNQIPPIAPGAVESLAAAIPRRLPVGLRAVAGSSTLAVLGPITDLSSIGGTPVRGRAVSVQLAMLTSENRGSLRLVAGRLPATTASGQPVEIVLSQRSATASGLAVGSVAAVSTLPVSSAISHGDLLSVRVVGLVSDAVPSGSPASPWADVPNLWAPTIPSEASEPIQLDALTDETGVATAVAHYSTPFQLALRIRLAPQKFTAALVSSVDAELTALAGRSERLAGSTGAGLDIVTGFGTALSDFPDRERATVAQTSVVSAGLLGVLAAVLVLVSRMLVLRREAELALERARGAALGAIAARSFIETLIAGAIAAGIGLTAVQLVVPGPFVDVGLLVAVTVVALLAVPVQGWLLVRGLWTGRKVPANRTDRNELQRRVRIRRIAVELTVIAVTIAALVSLSTRSLLETQTSGVDPLLSSAPLLFAASIAIIILRVYRWPVRLGIAAGRRSRGALGLLAAVRAERSIALIPLLSLTLAVALAVGGGLLASTVSAGQDAASWQRIGADARVRATVTTAQIDTVEQAPGVTASTAFGVQDGVQLRLPGGTDFATLVSVDSRFAGLVGSLPAGGASASGAASLGKLFSSGAASGTVPVVVDPQIAGELSGSRSMGMYVGTRFVSLRVVGVTDESLAGYLAAPFIFVDRAALGTSLGHLVTANTMLANGPGAASAVARLHEPSSAVTTRAGWLAQRRGLALVRGVNQAITLATLATALAAVLALVVILLAGARERGRSLALVRTLGFPARLGWWLALAEIAPVLIAALIGGIAAGVGIVVLLEPAMGLQALAGGLGNPPPTISPALIAELAGVAILLLLIAGAIEVLVRRRDRLSEVLRVGESL